MDILADLRPSIRAFHVIAVIAFMAGMLYLPRLFVYHAEAPPGSAQSEVFKVMERRLLRAIINPAMIALIVLGVLLGLTPGVVDWGAGWVWVKIAALAAMFTVHGFFARWRRAFAEDRNRHSVRFFRRMNEVPTVLMIVIVVVVVTKAF
ncbi:MAG: protoporphyrinogen oxidase HemJ [Alphaproteobacteria bacterium]|nr:protoporphyrinogen oxidase HemJ [Alphaproteobacteria bacterium]